MAGDSPTFARIAVERGIDRFPEGLTYGVTAEQSGISAGDLVRVPLGRGSGDEYGWVVAVGGAELADGIELSRIRPIHSIESVRLPGQLLNLGRWISSYYCCPLGMTFASILPAAVRRGVGGKRRVFVDTAGAEPALLPARKPTAAQRRVLDFVAALGAGRRPIEEGELAAELGLRSPATIRTLVKMGLLAATERTSVEASWGVRDPDARFAQIPEWTTAQRTVIDSISPQLPSTAGFSQHLLHGVTGSGKTEVYLALAAQVLAAGRSAIILVPEISLTPQTAARLLARLSNQRVLLLHSGLTAAQRHEQWVLGAVPGPKVVLGARSAVFAPIPDGELGLVIVDEEHDSSYKQDQAPRYHGRDVAIRRAQLANCPVLLGSATPSLESWHNAVERHRSTLHRLPQRAPGLRTPRVQIVDFRAEMNQWGDHHVHLIGPTLQRALERALNSGRQAILLLNRRGYANWVACSDRRCGWMLQCDHCSVGMVVHHGAQAARSLSFLRCHHCHTEQRVPSVCPQCGRAVSIFGLGTQRIEEELQRMFPVLAGTLARVDSDSMQTADDFHNTLGAFGRGELRVLLGTQMIAKGLDFPGVGLVGVISADTALNLPDFRASERTYQLVAQVAGRCGRADQEALAVIQTFQPDAAPIRAAADGTYESFATAELAARREFGLPPVRRMARMVVRSTRRDEALADAAALQGALAGMAAATGSGANRPAVEVSGFSPCPIERLADYWRVQVEVLANGAASLAAFLAEARSRGVLRPSARLAVDVDPVALL